MEFRSAISLGTESDLIVKDICDQLGVGDGIDLAIVFVRPSDENSAERLLEELRSSLGAKHIIGCTAGGVLGCGREVEDGVGTSVIAARLPGVVVEPIAGVDSGGDETLPEDARVCILLADPFTTSTERVLQKFNRARSGVPVIGGVASWAMSPGQNRLVSDHGVTNSGFVGVVLRGSVDVDVVVSQGCRPVGETYTVTSCQGNVISELDQELPLQILEQVFADADQEDQSLMRSGILVGRGVSLDREALGRGSFLVRGVIGADRESGAISVADHMKESEIVQFHVRDAMTARDDLEMLLIPQAFEDKPAGVLLFTCNGRGERFFGQPNVDVTIVGRALGDDIPLAGFFCGGEIGPIGNSNFIHGYTASMAIFRPERSAT